MTQLSLSIIFKFIYLKLHKFELFLFLEIDEVVSIIRKLANGELSLHILHM